jgi:hypothetical protein
MQFTFRPTHSRVARIQPIHSLDLIKNEPMLFGADFNFAKQHGGQLTLEAMKKLLSVTEIQDYMMGHHDELNLVIDSRVTHTQVGQYPSIPGWHCDDVPRILENSGLGQPQLDEISADVKHFMVLVATDMHVSNTQFIDELLTLQNINSKKVWSSVDAEIRANEKVQIKAIAPGDIIQFTQQDIHRATPTYKSGWRWFFRLSLTHRKPQNEIRNQVQVYIGEDSGW